MFVCSRVGRPPDRLGGSGDPPATHPCRPTQDGTTHPWRPTPPTHPGWVDPALATHPRPLATHSWRPAAAPHPWRPSPDSWRPTPGHGDPPCDPPLTPGDPWRPTPCPGDISRCGLQGLLRCYRSTVHFLCLFCAAVHVCIVHCAQCAKHRSFGVCLCCQRFEYGELRNGVLSPAFVIICLCFS